MPHAIGPISGVENLDADFDVKSAVQDKYGEFLDILMLMAKSMEDDEPVVFPGFQQEVRPSDVSFNLYAQHSMNQISQQLETILNTEKFKRDIEKQVYSLFS
jgi:hypothetical protein